MELEDRLLAALQRVALRAARAAGEVLRGGFGRCHRYELKSSRVDLVTDYDRRSEEEIVRVIQRAFPDHAILSEERAQAQEQEQEGTGPSSSAESEFKWIIDPLDGTTNYAHGYPLFAVSIALERAGELLLGVVYNPVLEELFLAVRGRGATLNGRPIRVSQTERLSQALLATGFPYELERVGLNLEFFRRFIYRAQAIRRDGAAAPDLCYVACGRFDGFWELDLKAWDIAAGVLIVKEAGGRVSDFSGDELDLYGNEILASNGLIHEEMVQVLQEGAQDQGQAGYS